MSESEYDLIVIGGGPAGEKGAAQAAYFGRRTILIETWHELGGACINWGTLASKTLRETALFLSGFRTRQLGEGLNVEFRADVSLGSFMHRKNIVQRREQERAARNLSAPWHRIERMTGRGRLAGPHTVRIARPDGTESDLTGRVILLAPGSTPARPANVAFDQDDIFDSTTVLDMKRLPRSLVVIGGGVVGSEYACLFNTLGVRTTLVHPKPRILDSLLDREIGDAFMARMQRDGIALDLGDSLADPEESPRAVYSENGQITTCLRSGRSILSDAVLYALGRDGNTKNLGLEELGIPVDKHGLVARRSAEIPNGFDPGTYQTCVPSVYVAGDVTGPPALASTSMEQGRLAMCHAFGLTYKTKLAPVLPAGIFTIPEISQAGKTEEDCVREKIPYVVGRDRFGNHARGQIIGETEGMIKLIFGAPGGELLGVHVIGELATELVHFGLACLSFGGGIDFFMHTVFNYPTLSDVYKYAAYDALGKLNALRAASAQSAT